MFELIKPFKNKFLSSYSSSSTLLIFKGFSFKFYVDLSKEFDPVNNIKDFTDPKDRLCLEKLNDKKNRRLITSRLLSDFKGIKFCSYEEVLLSNIRLDDLDCKIYFVNNDLFSDKIVNPTNEKFLDFEREISSDLTTPKLSNKNFSSIFSFSYINNLNTNYLQYRSYTNSIVDDITSIDFFQFTLGDPMVISDFDISKKNHPKISLSDKDSLIELIESVYNNSNLKKEYSFILSDNFRSLTKNILEISLLKKILSIKNVQLNFYKETKFKSDIIPRKEIREILKKHWNSDNFRDVSFYKNPDKGSAETITIKQDFLIEKIIRECERAQISNQYNDIFITAPTGAGKSLFFQIPAIYLGSLNLVTIIVSPLKSLMYDQVQNLENLRSVENSTFLNSDLSPIEKESRIEGIKSGEYDIVYLSPELLLSYSIDHFIGDRKIGLLAVDEAHLVTEWGKGFRVDYWYLGTHLNKLKKYYRDKSDNIQYFPIIALTATAVYGGPDDVVFETLSSLNMDVSSDSIFIGSVKRNNIELIHNKFDPSGSYKDKKQEKTIQFIEDCVSNKIKTIAYFPFTTHIDKTFTLLSDNFKDRVMPYHSKLDAFHKKEAQDKFKNNEISVVLASKAFGMGVDISDIENVYHHAPSSSLSDYVQEIGRAARTKSIEGKSITFFNDNDLQYSKILFGLSSIKQYQIKWILKKLISLYDLNGSKQNMLINTDDFKHIFGDNSNKNNEVDNKIQSCLMMIEKDFQNNAGFPVILARPKRLFGKVFAEVPISKESEFKKLFSKYIKLIKKSTSDSSMVSYDRFGRRTEIITPGTTNPIYLIHLDLLWEEIDQFRKMNFAQLKSLFFKKELFFKNKKNADEEQEEEKVSPIQRLEISFNSGYDKNLILFEFEEIWEKLINIFISFNGKYFTRSDFISKVRIYFPDKSSSYYNGFEELLTIFKVRAKSFNNWTTNERVISDYFIETQKKSQDVEIGKFGYIDNQTFRCNKNIYRVKREFLRYANFLINETLPGEYKAIKYLNLSNKRDRIFLKIAQIFEFVDLATFEIKGGTDPKIFVRINDPNKLRVTASDDYYLNGIAQDVYDRYDASNKLLSHFFNSTMKSSEKWNFIENYFLGHDFRQNYENID